MSRAVSSWRRPLRGFLIVYIAVPALSVLTLGAPWFYQPRWLVSLLKKICADAIFHVDTRERVFALTFDDGPHPTYTPQVLDILDRYEAKATFFVIGKQVEKSPETLEAIRDRGHQVANHFYDGWGALFASTKGLERSLKRNEALIQQEAPGLLRPAGGLFRTNLVEVAERNGYRIVLGSAYTQDPAFPPRWYMRWAFRRMLRPGAIVILHDGRWLRQRTVDVMPAILDAARKQDLRPVTLHELIRSGEAD